jgi:hypothetical protein
MKRLLTATLSTLSLVAIVSPSFAQEIAMLKHQSTKIDYLNQERIALKNISHSMNQTSPVNLVGIAYQGFLSQQGIPSGGQFIYGIKRGNITAEVLVQSGIDNGRLSSDTLNDKNYLNAVKTALKNFMTN